MAAGLDYMYLFLGFFILCALLFCLVLVGQNLQAPLNQVTGFNTVNPALAPISGAISPLAATNSVLNIYYQFDNYLPWLFFLIGLGIIGANIVLPQHPVTLVLSFLSLLVLTITAFITSNLTHTFFANPVFANVIGYFPQVESLMANLATYGIFFMLLLMIVTAARYKGGGGNPPLSGGSGIGTMAQAGKASL